MKPRLRFLYSVQWVEGRTGHDHPERLTHPYAVRSSSALSLADRSCPLFELILRTTPVLVLPWIALSVARRNRTARQEPSRAEAVTRDKGAWS